MTEAWLTWKLDYVKTNDGILMATQTGVGLIGGIVSASLPQNTDIESFVYWMTFFVSGIFLLSYCSSLIETVQEKIPQINTIVKLIFFYFKTFKQPLQQLFYLCIWSVFLFLNVIYRLIYCSVISVNRNSVSFGPVIFSLLLIFLFFFSFSPGFFYLRFWSNCFSSTNSPGKLS